MDDPSVAATTVPFETTSRRPIGKMPSAAAATLTCPGPEIRTVSPGPAPSTSNRSIGPPVMNVLPARTAPVHAE
jgi:hypothetical protein